METMLIYLFALLALTLNPLIWIRYRKSRFFLTMQVVRLVAGLLIIFILTYFALIDQNGQSLLSYGSLFVGIFLILDLIFIQKKRFAWTPLVGVLFLLFFCFLHFFYPVTQTQAKYRFIAQHTTIVAKEKESMDEQHIPVVSEPYARYKSEKLLGEIAHVSYYELGHTSLQKIDGSLYWVTPIEYSGFFQWLKSRSVPGYIRMSAEDENAGATLIHTKMKYVPSAYFNDNLKRHVRFFGQSPVLFSASFEPDDSGKPYYVIPYGYYEKLRQIPDIKGVFLVDPKSGAVRRYSVNRVPAFVDQVIPSSVAEMWNQWYGENVHGFWNKFFSKEDIKKPTAWSQSDEVNGVFDRKLHLNWFTDFTRPKSGSGAMVGYSMLNTRTGKMFYYSGANGLLNGKSAMNIAEKTFKQNHYDAGIPTLYTIYGQETWVVPLMDTNDVLREMMLVNAKNENVYSAETDKQTLFDNYKYILATKMTDDTSVPTARAHLRSISGTVAKIYKYQDNDTHQTMIEFMLQGNKRIFTVSSDQNPYAVFLENGDTVSASYHDTSEIVTAVQKLQTTQPAAKKKQN
ncbi:MAG: hypothetical protein ACE3JK_11605 [Sporolactobacillus sp.]